MNFVKYIRPKIQYIKCEQIGESKSEVLKSQKFSKNKKKIAVSSNRLKNLK